MRVICTGKNILSTNVLNQNNLIAYILVFDGDRACCALKTSGEAHLL
jgi:hypothetical protein